MRFNLVDAVVGQKIGIARSTRYGLTSCAFGTVTKVNGHGHIFVDVPKLGERRFDKYGDSYKDEWGPSLINADDLRTYLTREKKQKEQRHAATALQKVIQDGFAGNGRYWNTAERLADIKLAVASLEELVD